MRGVLIALVCLLAVGHALPDEARLRKDLLTEYDPVSRPAPPSGPVEVTLGMMLIDLQLDRGTDTVDLNAWMQMEWTDNQLSWQPNEYGGLESTRFQPQEVWVLDLIPYDMRPVVSNDWLSPQLLVGFNNGSVIYVPPAGFKARCQRDHAAEPSSDTYTCVTKLGSWTYSEEEVDLKLSSDTVDVSQFNPSGDWALQSSSVVRRSKIYPCCPGHYVSVDITLVLKPRDSSSATCGEKRCHDLAKALRDVLAHN